MIAVTGFRTSIVKALGLRTGEPLSRINGFLDDCESRHTWPEGCERFVLAAGVLRSEQILGLGGDAIRESLAVNLVSVMLICEQILERVPRARIVVVGSVSGRDGSFDQVYAATKAGVHCYVKTRLVQLPQLLYCVAPTIISDSGMTMRRADYPAVLGRRPSVTSMEVAEVIAAALYAPDSELERLNNQVKFLEGTPT